ncbi:MAG: hypothetical protein Q8P67_10130 [archaeon]|nr:hypothetical protein [archaeon]
MASAAIGRWPGGAGQWQRSEFRTGSRFSRSQDCSIDTPIAASKIHPKLMDVGRGGLPFSI